MWSNKNYHTMLVEHKSPILETVGINCNSSKCANLATQHSYFFYKVMENTDTCISRHMYKDVKIVLFIILKIRENKIM